MAMYICLAEMYLLNIIIKNNNIINNNNNNNHIVCTAGNPKQSRIRDRRARKHTTMSEDTQRTRGDSDNEITRGKHS